MKNKYDIDQLLAAAQRHYDDERRQQQLADLVDQWAAEETATAEPRKVPLAPVRHRRYIWYGVAASVALLLASGIALSVLKDGAGESQVAGNHMEQLRPDTTAEVLAPRQEESAPMASVPTERVGEKIASVSVAPITSVTPVAPITPVTPVAPITPVAPVDQNSAVASEAPVAPISALAPVKAMEYVASNEQATAEEEASVDEQLADAAPQAFTVKERVSTKLVGIGSVQPSVQPATEPRREGLPSFLAFMPMGRTDVKIDIYTIDLR